jgi:LmbE family N-acetylglucosaminyl deacetylase
VNLKCMAELRLTFADRILVVAPHPDDEILSAAGLLQRAAAMGLAARVLWLTHGDANRWSFFDYRKRAVLLPSEVRAMGEVRTHEALAGIERLGLPSSAACFLGYPDGGLMELWSDLARDGPPRRGRLTRAEVVPYASALRPGAPHKGAEILRDVTAVLRDFRPTKVMAPHPADRHSDHQAGLMFVQRALQTLADDMQPVLYGYLIHWPDWPAHSARESNEDEIVARTRRDEQEADAVLEPPRELRGNGWQNHLLSVEEIAGKRRALQEHHTQLASPLARLMAYVKANEPFIVVGANNDQNRLGLVAT